jgi:predicted nucleotidyltransferase
MSSTISRDTIQRMVDRVVERFRPTRVVLFGSHARGEASADSDVDLLIVMPLAGGRLATAVEIRKVLRGFGVAKDVVLLTPEEYERKRRIPGTIAWPAEHEGIVLHAA